jgi:hypothetical protein
MPSSPDSINVKTVQVDAPAGQPFDEPINTLVDGFKIAGIFFVETGEDNLEVGVWRDGDNLRFRDVLSPGVGTALIELLTEARHAALDTLLHGVIESYHEQITRVDGKVSNITYYTDSSETKKIREVQLTRASGKVSQVVTIQYDGDGLEKERLTEALTRVSGKVDSIDGVVS